LKPARFYHRHPGGNGHQSEPERCKGYSSDAGTIRIRLNEEQKTRVVGLVASLEQLQIELDSRAKIVLNERTGTGGHGRKRAGFPRWPLPTAISAVQIKVRAERESAAALFFGRADDRDSGE